MAFSNLYRHEQVEKLKNEDFDVLIIGGGITGAGIALDGQTRGMKMALIEMQDFAAGTSSRSTKLVHGGLRYLKQMEIKMVAEVGKERSIVYENGPHVTTPEWMLLPIHKGGTFRTFSTSIGLWMYDFLAGVKKSERRTILSPEETIAKEPLLKKDGLKGSGYYVEYRTDDARLTIEVMKAAAEKGAAACNYIKAVKLVYDENKVIGALVEDQLTGETYEIHGEKIVNAAGPWVDDIREMDCSKKGKTLKLSKGVHIVIDGKRFPLKQAVYFDTPDSRMVFAIPRDGKTYMGTTDTFVNEAIPEPKITTSDRSYLIQAINYMFPEVNISGLDIESSWAGIRPLILEEGKKPSEISRKDEIWESHSGLITIAGGKLTGYRKMAETVVDLLVSKFKIERGSFFLPCQTKNLPISGGDIVGSKNLTAFIESKIEKGVDLGLTNLEAGKLARIYGSNIDIVFDLLKANKDDAVKFDLPIVIFAKLIYAIEKEMIATPIDFFVRRTGALWFDISIVKNCKSQVISYMADKFLWSDSDIKKYTLSIEKALNEAVIPVNGNG
ncbi:glycerol-3-phosphate dehydrogenase/oxidase [Neobacillus mesonae]|uniref:glycerol-3-phosphate dehydrogenase/oxidase n=1 Tax=Neobacillus mesonae TaxID=1193713 RepID=UPI00203A9A7A|nr:glycerol-3-phosphate dehydrogenase/oxidase [Neobacillus mesonae]MCM3568720.1 glycerol-3-phosphate dehydrogenase/oxidase [Neobacillus mesonae]